jgi:hypothetical protein
MTESQRTDFRPLPSVGPTMPQFGPSSEMSNRTQGERAAAIPQFESEPTGLIEWLGTPEARRLAGQWVLLTDGFEVLDHAHSPTDLLRRHPNLRTPLVVFVDPPDINLAV